MTCENDKVINPLYLLVKIDTSDMKSAMAIITLDYPVISRHIDITNTVYVDGLILLLPFFINIRRLLLILYNVFVDNLRLFAGQIEVSLGRGCAL